LALGPDGPAAVRDDPSVDEDSEGRYYYIPWRPGESKTQFLIRAGDEFDRQKQAEESNGSVAASDRINPKHVEWLVRFQLNGEEYGDIAKGDGVDRSDLTKAILAAADLLDLKLRTARRGRPLGSGHPVDTKSPHREKTPRR
jgi:hypothetical protein